MDAIKALRIIRDEAYNDYPDWKYIVHIADDVIKDHDARVETMATLSVVSSLGLDRDIAKAVADNWGNLFHVPEEERK